MFGSDYKRSLQKQCAIHHPLVPEGATATFPFIFFSKLIQLFWEFLFLPPHIFVVVVLLPVECDHFAKYSIHVNIYTTIRTWCAM